MFLPHEFSPKVITRKEGNLPSIVLSELAYHKIRYIVSLCSKEVGWLGTVEKFENVFAINDVFLFEQEVNHTTCELSAESLAKFATDVIQKDPVEGSKIVNNLRLWGHSHVNMGTFASGQDDTQMEAFKNDCEWFVRMIANKKGRMEFSIYLFKDGIEIHDVEWVLCQPEQASIKEFIEAELKEKVKEQKPYIYTYAYGGNQFQVPSKPGDYTGKRPTIYDAFSMGENGYDYFSDDPAPADGDMIIKSRDSIHNLPEGTHNVIPSKSVGFNTLHTQSKQTTLGKIVHKCKKGGAVK